MFIHILSFYLIFQNLERVQCLNKFLRSESVLYGLATLTENYENKSICLQQLNQFYKSVDQKHVWALKALDASGRPTSGFLYGNNFWIGSHSQCDDIANRKPLEVNYDKIKRPLITPYDYPPYPLGFVAVRLKHNNTLQHHSQLPLEFMIRLGLCMPKSCQSEDLYEILPEYFNSQILAFQNLYQVNFDIIEIKPLGNTEWLLKETKTILLITIATTIFILSIIGTIYDVRKHNREKNIVIGQNGLTNGKNHNDMDIELTSNNNKSILGNILKCFSIYSNVKSLVKTKLPPDSIPIIHGLRFFGMLWVIMVHAVFYQADYINNIAFAYRLSEDIFAQILSNSTYCVDTYLFLSGFLLAYLFFKSKSKQHKDSGKKIKYSRKLNEFLLMTINRVLRLTAPYLVIILFTNVLFTYYRNANVLVSNEYPDTLCSKYWWRNILYINNLFPRSEMCLSWSWYLSVDMQFFIITSFLLILSTICFQVAAVITILLIVANVILTTYNSYSIGYIPTMDEQLIQLDVIYDLPWNRIGPYLIGVITAYVLLIKMQKKLVLKERTRIFLWVVFPLLNLWILFTLYTRQLSVEFSAIYMGISRTLWGVGLGWLVVACCTRNARALEKFLAFKGWIPLSRLTYCAYLLNPIVANMMFLGSETSYQASLATFAICILGVTMTTFFLAFIFSMLFESPFILLTKMMVNHLTKRKSSEKVVEQPNENSR